MLWTCRQPAQQIGVIAHRQCADKPLALFFRDVVLFVACLLSHDLHFSSMLEAVNVSSPSSLHELVMTGKPQEDAALACVVQTHYVFTYCGIQGSVFRESRSAPSCYSRTSSDTFCTYERCSAECFLTCSWGISPSFLGRPAVGINPAHPRQVVHPLFFSPFRGWQSRQDL